MASYEVVNNVAVITCQNPPVNQLSYNLRVGLFDGLEKALADDNVVAIVIAADGKTFIAGADIKEFSNGMVHISISITLIVSCGETNDNRNGIQETRYHQPLTFRMAHDPLYVSLSQHFSDSVH